MSNRSLFLQALDRLLQKHPTHAVVFARDHTEPPLFSHVVNFPRLEIPLSGVYEMEIEQEGESRLIAPGAGTALIAPPNCWNRPTWKRPVRLMSFLFGRRQLGISIVTCDGRGEESLTADKLAIPRPLSGPGEKLLQAILEIHQIGEPYPAFAALVHCLLHTLRALVDQHDVEPGARAHRLFEEICFHLQRNYARGVTRDSVAAQFGVSGNHLSRLFREQGHMGFSEYLTYVRVDRAKFLLLRYPMRLDEIAQRCGFGDTAYFCRVFKKITRKTPSRFRQTTIPRR